MSKAEFIAKLNISLKEIHETCYWLELLHDTSFLTDREYTSISADAVELRKILIAIIKSSRNRR